MTTIRGREKLSHFRANSRLKKRIDLTFPADSRIVRATTVDIGLGGVFIATDVVLPRGTMVELSFHLPMRPEPLVVPGVVRWVNDGKTTERAQDPQDAQGPQDDRPTMRGMGISFSDAAPSALLALSEYLTSEQ